MAYQDPPTQTQSNPTPTGQSAGPGTPPPLSVTPPNATPSLASQANSIAASEVAGQVAPLQAQEKSTLGMENSANAAIQSEFKSLLPSVETSAQQVQKFNNNAQGASQQIFQSAGEQLNTLAQNQAAQAQQLAQSIGSPVSTGTFTASSAPYQSAEAASGAVGQLTTLNLGLGSDMSAQKFAGQVFPAMETEQLASNRQVFGQQVRDLQNKIAITEGNQSKLAAAQLPGLIKAQQTYEYDRAKLALSQWTASNNNYIKLQQLGQRDAALAQAAQRQIDTWNYDQQKLRQGAQIANQRATLEQNRINATTADAAARLNLSKAEYNLRASQYAVSDSIARQRLQVQQEGNVRSIIDAALGGTSSNKPVSVTVRQNLAPDSPQVKAATSPIALLKGKAPGNIFMDPKTGQWYTYVHQTMTPTQFNAGSGGSGTPTSDPQGLYDMIHQALPSANPKMITGIINLRLGLKGWVPGRTVTTSTGTKTVGGTKTNYTPQDLSKMSLSQLTGTAETLGFAPSPTAVGRGRLTDFILHRAGTYTNQSPPPPSFTTVGGNP